MKIIKPLSNAVPFAADVVTKYNLLADGTSLTFSELRVALGKTEKQLPDGAIHQALIDAGFINSVVGGT